MQNTFPFQIRLHPKLVDALDEIAESHKITRNALVRRILMKSVVDYGVSVDRVLAMIPERPQPRTAETRATD